MNEGHALIPIAKKEGIKVAIMHIPLLSHILISLDQDEVEGGYWIDHFNCTDEY